MACRPQRITERRALVELAIGYGMILLVLWTPPPWQRPLYLTAAVVLTALMSLSFRGGAALGLRRANLLGSLWIAGAAVLAALALIAVSAHLHALRPFGGFSGFFKRYWGYALWAFVQQLVLQGFFLARLLDLTRDRRAVSVIAAAVLFAAAHLPNPVLTPITFVWGLMACALFLRYRNLIPLALAHAAMGIALAAAIPAPITHGMRAGLGYLTYRPSRVHHSSYRSHADHTVSTHAWVMAEAPTLRS